ncbi:MAG TPA: hypothetical protein VE338_20615 [Ktedonobacterales bacterium]|jgi:hypothetical protein|nr:hypothetical protein [Ktedonobacterales bacterium]
MITTEAPGEATSATGKNRWFQLGLLSAGAAAPLFARWRSLRAAEQAEAMREQAATRWNDAIARVTLSRPQEAIQETWRQMAPQAQESFRQVGAAARDALQRLPSASPSESTPSETTTPNARRVSATLWLVGVGVGVVAAGAVAYIVLRNRMGAATDDDALVEIPLTVVTPRDAATVEREATEAAEGPAIVTEPPEEEPGVAEPTIFSDDDAEGAAFVGNILSRVYHSADSARLPAPQHRIYFATEEEAISAGYRPDGAELASRSSDVTGQRE